MGCAEMRRVAGLMSGTSLDGVDAALIITDGCSVQASGHAVTIPYTPGEQAALGQAVRDALTMREGQCSPASFSSAEQIIHQTHVRAVRELQRHEGAIDLIGFHGQTLLHRPECGQTLQLGDAGALAEALGIDVVADLRLEDMRQGGQGAPIVPVYHAALAQRLPLPRPLCFLNIGGVANLTWIGANEELMAFDVGPGNGLIDEFVWSRGLGRYDADGRLGLSGVVDNRALGLLMQHRFFGERPPKSLDRYDFKLDAVAGMAPADACATLAAFTAEAVAAAVALLPAAPSTWVVCGGGCRNAAIMQQLGQRLAAPVMDAAQLGLRADALEAEAMAYLAMRSRAGLPITYPMTTGAPRPLRGGHFYPAAGSGR